MKKVNLLKLYCLLLLSSGLYGFVWSYRLIDQLSEEDGFPNQRIVDKRWAGGLVIGFLGVLFAGIFIFSNAPSEAISVGERLYVSVLSFFAIAVQLSLLNNIIVVNNYLKARKRLRTPSTVSLVFFYFFFCFSLVNVQSVVNDYVDLRDLNEAE